jgi:glycosyltransferase involved in cell wall biosynthesis
MTLAQSLPCLKVAIIMPLAELRGGGEMSLWDLMQYGRDQGIEWLVIFLEQGPMQKDLQALGIETRVVESGRLRQPHRLLKALYQIATLLRQEQIQVVVGWMTKAHLYGGLPALLAGVPILRHQLCIPSHHNWMTGIGGWMEQLAAWIPTQGIIAVSNEGMSAQRQFCPTCPIELVYPGVALERFNPDRLPHPPQLRQQLGLPLSGPLIGMVGRLQRWKGMHVLIEAMPQVLQHYPEAHCVIVGGEHSLEPGYVNDLKQQIKTLHLNEKVILAGLQHNIPEWMQAIDVIVHASDNEPFGLVIVEAMALGKPVVAGDRGGPREIITPGVNGLLSPYNDPDRLAAHILQYLNDPVFARQMGVAARQKALSFSSDRYATRFIQVMRRLISPERLEYQS